VQRSHPAGRAGRTDPEGTVAEVGVEVEGRRVVEVLVGALVEVDMEVEVEGPVEVEVAWRGGSPPSSLPQATAPRPRTRARAVERSRADMAAVSTPAFTVALPPCHEPATAAREKSELFRELAPARR